VDVQGTTDQVSLIGLALWLVSGLALTKYHCGYITHYVPTGHPKIKDYQSRYESIPTAQSSPTQNQNVCTALKQVPERKVDDVTMTTMFH